MADPYWRYGASTDRASIPRPALPGYLTSEASTLTSQPLWSSHVNTSDFPQKDYLSSRPGAYGADDIMGIGARPESGYSGYAGGASLNGYPSALSDPYLLGRRDVTPGTGPRIPDMVNERPDPLKRVDGLPPVGTRESNVLFVDELPSDCSRREVSHLFRPFIGFREIRVVHKEPRNREDKAMVLCFVEFSDAKCALTALEALQGYKFDNKKVNSPALRIQFAHFPFQLPSDGDDQRLAVPRENFQPEQRKDFQDQTKTQDLLSKRCEKCKKPHGDRPCPTLKDGCFKCGKKGHKAKDCMPKELRMCFICQESGHISPNCPQKTKKVTTSDFPSK